MPQSPVHGSRKNIPQTKHQFTCAGAEALFAFLADVQSPINGRYEPMHPYYAGGEGILMLAQDRLSSGGTSPVLLKFPRVDYTRCAYLERSEYQRRAEHLESEAAVLRAYGGSVFPKIVDLFCCHSVLLPSELEMDETCLVMEFLRGATFADIRGRWNQHIATRQNIFVESVLVELAAYISASMEELWASAEPLVYTDLCPENIFICAGSQILESSFRLLDAGAVQHPANPPRSFRLRYLPPNRAHAVASNSDNSPWQPVDMIQQLGRVLYELAVNRVPEIGEALDLSLVKDFGLSQGFCRTLQLLSDGQLNSFAEVGNQIAGLIRHSQLNNIAYQLQGLLVEEDKDIMR